MARQWLGDTERLEAHENQQEGKPSVRPGDVADTGSTSQAAQGRTRGHRGDCTQPYPHPCHHPGPCHCPHPCHASRTALQGSSSPHLQGKPLRSPVPDVPPAPTPVPTWLCLCPLGHRRLPRPITLPGHQEHGAHREPCWDVPGCRGGRRLVLGRSQRQRFEPRRAVVQLCRTTPCPVSHIPVIPAPDHSPLLLQCPRTLSARRGGSLAGSAAPLPSLRTDTRLRHLPGPLPVLPGSCWHEALTQHSSPESPVPEQPNFQALRAGALCLPTPAVSTDPAEQGALTALPAPSPAPHTPVPPHTLLRVRRDAAPRAAQPPGASLPELGAVPRRPEMSVRQDETRDGMGLLVSMDSNRRRSELAGAGASDARPRFLHHHIPPGPGHPHWAGQSPDPRPWHEPPPEGVGSPLSLCHSDGRCPELGAPCPRSQQHPWLWPCQGEQHAEGRGTCRPHLCAEPSPPEEPACGQPAPEGSLMGAWGREC